IESKCGACRGGREKTISVIGGDADHRAYSPRPALLRPRAVAGIRRRHDRVRARPGPDRAAGGLHRRRRYAIRAAVEGVSYRYVIVACDPRNDDDLVTPQAARCP